MKLLIIVLIPFLMIGSYFVGLYQGKPARGTSQGRVSTPSPTASFVVRQQCANDANTLLTRLNQEDKYSTFNLQKSAYSGKLNSCVADIITTDSTGMTIEETYDTTSGEILAHFNSKIPTSSSVPDKLVNATYDDYSKYDTSLGL